MQKVESSRKRLYKLEVLALKLIPMIIATCCLLNSLLSYLNIETEILSYLSGIGLLPTLFLYLSSLVFKFCIYHRMFIYYIIINNIVCYIDYKYGIPIPDKDYLNLHIFIAGIFLFIILYLKFKLCKH